MQRTIAVLLLTTLLVSCGGGTRTTGVVCAQQYWDGTIGLCLPAGWTTIDRETLSQRGVPEDVMAAFQAEKAVSGQLPTITVTRETLNSPVESPAYSQASIRAVAALPGYKVIDSRPIQIESEDVEIHIYMAKPLPEEPERRFYQVSAVSKGIGYSVTSVTPLTVPEALEQEVLFILSSLRFTEPVVEEE